MRLVDAHGHLESPEFEEKPEGLLDADAVAGLHTSADEAVTPPVASATFAAGARASFWKRVARPSPGLIGAFLVALCIVVHLRGLANGFVSYDDGRFITENPAMQEGLHWRGMVWAFTTDAELYFIPVTWLSHLLDCQIYGLRPWGHHLTSIMLHTLNTLLLFLVLTRMTGAAWPAALTAALFAVHPLHVESVAWVSERKDVLSAFFWMLTLGAYLRYTRRPNVRRYLLVLIVFALGLMAKPMLMTLPWILLLLDYWPLERVRRCEGVKGEKVKAGRILRRCALLVLEKVPLFVLAIADALLAYSMMKRGAVFTPAEHRPLDERLLHGVVASAGYLLKMIWPAGLAPYYPYPEGFPPLGQAAGAAVLLIAITGVAVFFWRRRPYLLVGWGWYMAALLPVIGLLQPVGFNFSDRYTYLPLIGVFLMVAWTLRGINGRLAFPGLVLAAFSITSIVQIGYWHDELTLFTHALAVTKDNVIAQNNVGLALAEKGQWNEAIAHYREALRIRPDFSHAHYNLGVALAGQGALQEAAAEYAEAIRVEPRQAKARNNLGNLLADQGRWAEAIEQYRAFLEQVPDSALAHNNLGRALAQLGRLEEAAQHFSQAVKLDPAYAAAHNNLGITLVKLGRFEEAAEYFTKATVLDPTNLKAYYNLGGVLMEIGRYDEALAQFKKLLDLDPADKQVRESINKATALRDSRNNK